MPRCCLSESREQQFGASYASVLVAGNELEAAVREMEGGQICPCVTSWCANCYQVSLLTTDLGSFKSPSAYYAHMLVQWRKQRGLHNNE
jgi:hypothetical protein